MAVGFSDTPPSSASTFKSRYRALPVHTLGYYLLEFKTDQDRVLQWVQSFPQECTFQTGSLVEQL
ncbi:nwd2 [Moniliophthora roreri]|nr:nwd2 [Moniliophthora roreri]